MPLPADPFKRKAASTDRGTWQRHGVPTSIRVRRVLVVLLAALAAAQPAAASEHFSDVNVRDVRLAVNDRGEALVTYTRANGTPRRVLVWGAADARVPDPLVPQVRFRYDYAGGWGKYRRPTWKGFVNRCRSYDGPPLVYVVAACKAPDGSYWALQTWQRTLPLLGFDPWLPSQSAWELHVSHWTGPLAQVDVSTSWTYGRSFEGLFGRVFYRGAPVHGFAANAVGNPKDRYGRNVYIDTLDSAYGTGWRRESGILLHRDTGTFCHSFVPQRPFPGYPSTATRPAAPGKRYRVTVMGPGVTPVVSWEGDGLGPFDASDPGDVARASEQVGRFDAWMAGDRVCARERSG
jgi:hypothetical protein